MYSCVVEHNMTHNQIQEAKEQEESQKESEEEEDQVISPPTLRRSSWFNN